MFKQPYSIQFSLPTWLPDFVNETLTIQNIEDRMSFIIEASRRNVLEKTGGPFAAGIFEIESGKLISIGVNLVTTQGSSILHAEMIAIAIAQRKLGTYDLGGEGIAQHELVTSAEPCAMCFGAIHWSGVRRVVTAAKDADVRSIGFDEGPKVTDWKKELADRQIEVLFEIKRTEAQQVLNEYVQGGGVIYNASESS